MIGFQYSKVKKKPHLFTYEYQSRLQNNEIFDTLNDYFSKKINKAHICPITVFLKPMSYFSLLRIKCDEEKCIHCDKCLKVCPMEVEVNNNSRKRKNATECILCQQCKKACPVGALK